MWIIGENFCSYECLQTADSKSLSHGFVSKCVPINREPKFTVGGAAVKLGSTSQGAKPKFCGNWEEISRALLKACLWVYDEILNSNRPINRTIAH